MSSLLYRLAAVSDTKLAAVTAATTNLLAQLCELNKLRERVRNAQQPVRRPQRVDNRRRRAFRN